MQTCAQGTRPGTFSLTDLQDLSIGDTKQMQTGCTADIGGEGHGSGLAYLKQEWFGWPENGEFEWGGLGDSCGMCAFQWGCECGGANIGGKRGRVKRKQYLGDARSCCLANFRKNQTKIIGDKTCAPEHRDPERDTCKGIIRPFCEEGNKIVTDSNCKLLETSNNTMYSEIMKTFCNKNENITHPDCINWCKENQTKCTTLSTANECIKYGICDTPGECATNPNCTPTAVNDIQAQCAKYGITMSSTGLQLYNCSRSGIDDLLTDCRENNIDVSICTPQKLQDTIDNEIQQQQLNLTQQAMTKSSENYETTRNAIMNMLSEPTDTTSTGTTSTGTTVTKTTSTTGTSEIIPGLDNNTFYIILGVLILLSCISSISSSLGVVVVI